MDENFEISTSERDSLYGTKRMGDKKWLAQATQWVLFRRTEQDKSILQNQPGRCSPILRPDIGDTKIDAADKAIAGWVWRHWRGRNREYIDDPVEVNYRETGSKPLLYL